MTPLITVISVHHLNENDKYLHWSLTSIMASVGISFEVICLSDAPECPKVPDGVRLIHDKDLINVTKKWNKGLELASKESKYVVLISDDVMISKYMLAELADTIGDNLWIMNPASNCDATTRYKTEFILNDSFGNSRKVSLKSTLEDIWGFEYGVINFPKERRILIDTGWISFYCTMFPKAVLKAVGELDERLDVRWNDYDYCARARKLGIQSLINLGVFCLHFGDRTLPKCTTQAQYDLADQAYREKNQ